MSAQSAIFNPTNTTSAATGDGFSVPRLTTTGRLAITFGTSDAGMMVYDTTLNNLFIWNGSAWESVPASGDAGANGSVQYNDNGVVSGAVNFVWDKTNSRVGIGTATPAVPLDVVGAATITGDLTVATDRLKVVTASTAIQTGATTQLQVGTTSWPSSVIGKSGSRSLFGNAGEVIIWNETAAAIGNYSTLIVAAKTGAGATTMGGLQIRAGIENASNSDGFVSLWTSNNTAGGFVERYKIDSTGVSTWSVSGSTAMTLNSTGLGVGGAPLSGFRLNVNNGDFRVSDVQNEDGVEIGWSLGAGNGFVQAYNRTTSAFKDLVLNNAVTITDAGNLLVGTTSGTYHTIRKNVTADAGNAVLEVAGNAGATVVAFYGVSAYGANAANAATKVGRDATTLRSINAGGTVNASGADYAEYMTKASDFVLSKGGIAGIDANGKLTNVFADAVSFAVKSTDPSYVGNDKWGVDLEGDALEAARQLVDRIAFAGQVPVNVTGAKAGDYIVPVVDGTGIKGIAVTSPTFEQYQLAVGKVIAIDADGRARIIVKVA